MAAPFILLHLIAAACVDPVASLDSTGRYDYAATDSAGMPVITGAMTYVVRADSSVTGAWAYRIEDTPTRQLIYGSEVAIGDWDLSGQVSESGGINARIDIGGTQWINVYWEVFGAALYGRWSLVSSEGTLEHGEFIAHRNSEPFRSP